MRLDITQGLQGLRPSLLVLCLFPIAAFAVNSGETGRPPTPHDARAFLAALHHADQAEAQLAQLALDRAELSPTREVARTIREDHLDLDRRVSKLAQDLSLSLEEAAPTGSEEQAWQRMQAGALDVLQSLRGPLVDSVYLSTMVTAHDRDIAAVERAQAFLSHDPRVLALAGEALPVLIRHRAIAYEALGQLSSHQGVGGSGALLRTHLTK